MAHGSDPEVHRGLTQAQGHLAFILTMLVDRRSCLDLAHKLQAVESTIRGVKRALTHCINTGQGVVSLEVFDDGGPPRWRLRMERGQA